MRTPLEREYEAWVMRGIDDYYITLNRRFATFAVSPQDEGEWPVDEAIAYRGKVIGLQFKRPKVGTEVYWNMLDTPGQLKKVKNRPEVFYALPAFTSREERRVALFHCYFWRPERIDARTPWRRITETWIRRQFRTMRWGEFTRAIDDCTAGVKRTEEQPLDKYLTDLRDFLAADTIDADDHEYLSGDRRLDDDDDAGSGPVWVYWFDLQG